MFIFNNRIRHWGTFNLSFAPNCYYVTVTVYGKAVLTIGMQAKGWKPHVLLVGILICHCLATLTSMAQLVF